MMKEKGNLIFFLVGLAMIVFFFVLVLPGLRFVPASPLLVIMYWAVVAVFITPPLVAFLGEKLVPSPFKDKGERIPKEYSKARSLVEQGMFEEAIEEYRRGLDKEPKNVALRLEIAEIYSRDMEDYRRALSELEECLTLRPRPLQGATILNRMADIYETHLSEFEAALTALRRIGEKWPGTKMAERAEERIRGIEQRLEAGR